MTPSNIKLQIQEDMKAAMRAQEKEKLAAIRLILAALKQREVDERIVLTDDQVISILDKMLKQRRESITQFEAAKRQDLIDKEVAEMKVIQAYLPTQLSDAEVTALIDAAITQAGASTAKDMGKVMGILKPQLQGRADIGAVSNKVKERLA